MKRPYKVFKTQGMVIRRSIRLKNNKKYTDDTGHLYFPHYENEVLQDAADKEDAGSGLKKEYSG